MSTMMVQTGSQPAPSHGAQRTASVSGRVWRQKGSSLIELVIVFVIVMVISGYAIPNTVSSIANMRLRGAASDFAGFVQQARIAAVRNNKTYTIGFGVPGANGAYLDLNANGAFDTGEPMLTFRGTANNVAAPAGASGKPSNLDASGGPVGWTATAGNVSFNARGLVCNASVSPCSTNVNYIFYFSDTRSLSGSGWAAVSVTVAGRPKVWWWNGSSWID